MDMFIKILKENKLFDAFTDVELMLLIQLCERRLFKKGESVFEEDVSDDGAVYFIEEGIIKIVKSSEGRRKLLAMFGVNNVFGEMSFLSPGQRSATATADEDVILHKLLPAKLGELEQHAPETAIKLLKVFIAKLVARLRQTDDALMKKEKGQKIIIT
jgi:CRP-like cAMP-binding protein